MKVTNVTLCSKAAIRSEHGHTCKAKEAQPPRPKLTCSLPQSQLGWLRKAALSGGRAQSHPTASTAHQWSYRPCTLTRYPPWQKVTVTLALKLLILLACYVTGEQSTTRSVRNICSYYCNGVSRWADEVIYWMASMRPFAKLISSTGVPGRDEIGLQCLWVDATRARDG